MSYDVETQSAQEDDKVTSKKLADVEAKLLGIKVIFVISYTLSYPITGRWKRIRGNTRKADQKSLQLQGASGTNEGIPHRFFYNIQDSMAFRQKTTITKI